MGARQRLTDEEIDLARSVIAKRREAQRAVSLYPSIAGLAETLGCSKRYLIDVLNETARKIPREASL